MTISKETLEKGLFHLRQEEETVRNQLAEISHEIKTQYVLGENFNVVDVSREWVWSNKEEDEKIYYEINFRHNTQDVNFTYRQYAGFDRIGWSSWSYSNTKDRIEQQEAIAKSLAYVSAVQEMLHIMADEDSIKQLTDILVAEWSEKFIPVQKELYKINDQISEIEKSIKDIDSKTELETARAYLVGQTRYTSERYEFNSRNYIREIKIESDAKGKLTIIDGNGRNKKVEDYMLVNIYRHLTKWNIKRETNWDVDYESPDRQIYYKYQNEVDSVDKVYNRNSDNMIKITKEEYEELRRY